MNYNHLESEEKWYAYWTAMGIFSSTPDPDKKPFTILMPPPNVTGVLHLGHMLNNTIQDALIRRARMQGYNACWVPGTDHAAIATEAKVVEKLANEGFYKGKNLSRETFLQHAQEWSDKYGEIILQQLRKLGVSCDWNRTRFTLEPSLYKAVIHSFVSLYNKGNIYRDFRMSHWDWKAKTALSDEEVNYQETKANLYYVNYKVQNSTENITIATTRPETILGDTAICVHPKDSRYTHLHGCKVFVPLINRLIPIITDEYVEQDFGSGALKITPAHDPNDYILGQKHQLPIIDILNFDGTLNANATLYIGTSITEARKKIIADLQQSEQLIKIEELVHNVGYSERTGVVVEPKLTKQWYLKMTDTAKPALENVLNNTIQFFPDRYKNLYKHWMENIRDWCISRQLWWGHRIPVWYINNNDTDFVVAHNSAEALQLAIEKTGNPNLTLNNLTQDEDVLDTWFSSWLWPISVFDGFETNQELKYYYPTSILVTGWDIIFFWVARMIMAGYEFLNEQPFKAVYFTGMVRDPQGRKMSKSLGNSPDALELIKQYSADGLRLGVLMSSPAGGDLKFDVKLCEQGRNFTNKIWNALKLIKGWEVIKGKNTDNMAAIEWFESKFNSMLTEIEQMYQSYRMSDILKTLYSFTWDDFCAAYLELIKPEFNCPIDEYTYQKTITFFENIVKILHPFVPFITEEIYQQLQTRTTSDSICIASYPIPQPINNNAIKVGDLAIELLSKIRDIRNKYNLKQREPLDIYIKADKQFLSNFENVLIKKGYLSNLHYTQTEITNAVSFLVGTATCFVELRNTINPAEELIKLQQDLEYYNGFKQSVLIKLNNEKFVQNAKPDLVFREQQKLADAVAKIKQLEENIAQLK